jgi:hypothetical protein
VDDTATGRCPSDICLRCRLAHSGLPEQVDDAHVLLVTRHTSVELHIGRGL